MVIDADIVSQELVDFVVEVFLDANRAYERVCWLLLEQELLKTRIPISVIRLIMDFVQLRTTRVRGRLGKSFFMSSRRTFCCGLPQGSVLGCVLFLIYIQGGHK